MAHTITERREASQSPAAAPARWMSIAEACAEAGCSRRTLHRWIDDERFASSRPIAAGSSRRRIDRESFSRFLAGEVGA